jgi:predicted flavoprotein YhiN
MKLTNKILKKTSEEYFSKINSKLQIDDHRFSGTKVKVFPEYVHWKKKNKDSDFYFSEWALSGPASIVMDQYISKSLSLAKHLLINNYPQEDIIKILPKGFSEYLVKKLK